MGYFCRNIRTAPDSPDMPADAPHLNPKFIGEGLTKQMYQIQEPVEVVMQMLRKFCSSVILDSFGYFGVVRSSDANVAKILFFRNLG